MPEDLTPPIDPDRLTPVQRHRLRKQGLLPPLPVCGTEGCGKRLITEATRERGICRDCAQPETMKEQMRRRRSKNKSE
jgi:hypothetical protein